jgi:hypothetical protein
MEHGMGILTNFLSPFLSLDVNKKADYQNRE